MTCFNLLDELSICQDRSFFSIDSRKLPLRLLCSVYNAYIAANIDHFCATAVVAGRLISSITVFTEAPQDGDRGAHPDRGCRRLCDRQHLPTGRPVLRHGDPYQRRRAPGCTRMHRGGRKSGAAPAAAETGKTDQVAKGTRRAWEGRVRVWRNLAGRASTDVHRPGVRDDRASR